MPTRSECPRHRLRPRRIAALRGLGLGKQSLPQIVVLAALGVEDVGRRPRNDCPRSHLGPTWIGGCREAFDGHTDRNGDRSAVAVGGGDGERVPGGAAGRIGGTCRITLFDGRSVGERTSGGVHGEGASAAALGRHAVGQRITIGIGDSGDRPADLAIGVGAHTSGRSTRRCVVGRADHDSDRLGGDAAG